MVVNTQHLCFFTLIFYFLNILPIGIQILFLATLQNQSCKKFLWKFYDLKIHRIFQHWVGSFQKYMMLIQWFLKKLLAHAAAKSLLHPPHVIKYLSFLVVQALTCMFGSGGLGRSDSHVSPFL